MNDRNDMTKKITAIFMSTLLSAMLLAGCTGSAVSGKTNSDYKGQTISGEVTEVSDDSITIEVSDKETATITVDSDTKITENQSGGPGNGSAPSGKPPQDDNAPSGQPPQDGNAPQGQPPEMNQDSSKSGSTQNNDSTSENAQNSQSQDANAPQDQNSDNNKAPQGQPPEMNNSGTEIKLSDIEKSDNVVITIDDDGDAESINVMQDNGMQNGGGGTSNANVEYTAVKTYDSDTSVSGETISSTGDEENAILVKGGSVDFDNMTVTRESDSSTGGDNASFYGVSAAVLGTDGTTKVTNSNITTDAEGGAGIFAYGDATVYASDSTIKTTKGSSGGIHAAGGGTLYAWDLDVTTAGQSSAAIRSDRGGGKMVVDGGIYTSTGVRSPAIYSTADISVNDAKLTAKGSEAICIEGKNQVRLFDTTLTGNMSDDEQNDCTWNVILYQSMSGDSEEGTSEFEMNGGELTAKNGGMFYTTNTSSKFVLKDVDITYADDNDFFLKATGNSNQRGWGQSGSNGADCDFTAIDQDMEGDIVWDKISTLDFYMTDGSTLKGAVVKDNSNAGNGKGGSCSMYIDSDSTWTVTDNSKVTNLYNAGTIKDASGNTVTIKDTDGTVYVKGTSKYTVTVNNYSTEDKTEKADKISSWSDYKVEKA